MVLSNILLSDPCQAYSSIPHYTFFTSIHPYPMREIPIPVLDPPAIFPTLKRGEVHVWCARLETGKDEKLEFQEFLSAEELSRAARFRFSRDRVRFTHAHHFLRLLLGRYCNQNPASLVFQVDEHRKPYLYSHPLEFNLSHSGGLTLLAVSLDQRLGVDVEVIRPIPEAEAIIKRLFSQREALSYANSPEAGRNRIFMKSWTRGEAVVKAVGHGFGDKLGSISGQQKLLGGDYWKIVSIVPSPNSIAAVAVQGSSARISCWWVVDPLPQIH